MRVDLVAHAQVAVEQRVAETVFAGLRAGGVVAGQHGQLVVVGTHAAENGPLVGQIHGVHERQGVRTHLPVTAPALAGIAAASQILQAAEVVAGNVSQAVAVGRAVAAVDAAVRAVGIGDGVVAGLDHVVGVLEARDDFVLHASDLLVPAQVGLVREVVHFLPAGMAAVDGRGGVVAIRANARGAAGTGGGIAVARGAVACQAGELGVGREAIVDARGERVDVGLQEVVALCIDRHVAGGMALGRGADQEAAQVGHVVLAAEAVVVHGHVQVGVHFPQARQCQALALAIRGAAVWHVFAAHQGVHAQGEGVVDGLVGVHRQAIVAIGAHRTGETCEVIVQRGLLGDHVHRAACGATACERGVRTLGDFHLFGREAFARGHARVAQAVHEHVGAGFLATDDVAVAEGVAVFAGAQGDAGLGAQNLLEVGGAGVIDGRLGDHRDGLRCLCQRAGVARVGGGLGLVGRADLGVRVRVYGLFLDCHGGQCFGGRGLRRGDRLGQGAQRQHDSDSGDAVGQAQAPGFLDI
ncbi:hypothetical protein SDC9_86907 [bioreactor metagenome]|uniref:Uncharacterized protein n=1 Tax=bioreactor metagenome TaxID=1076179 RepID=A0A644ZHR2_9ZZZZ